MCQMVKYTTCEGKYKCKVATTCICIPVLHCGYLKRSIYIQLHVHYLTVDCLKVPISIYVEGLILMLCNDNDFHK